MSQDDKHILVFCNDYKLKIDTTNKKVIRKQTDVEILLEKADDACIIAERKEEDAAYDVTNYLTEIEKYRNNYTFSDVIIDVIKEQKWDINKCTIETLDIKGDPDYKCNVFKNETGDNCPIKKHYDLVVVPDCDGPLYTSQTTNKNDDFIESVNVCFSYVKQFGIIYFDKIITKESRTELENTICTNNYSYEMYKSIMSPNSGYLCYSQREIKCNADVTSIITSENNNCVNFTNNMIHILILCDNNNLVIFGNAVKIVLDNVTVTNYTEDYIYSMILIKIINERWRGKNIIIKSIKNEKYEFFKNNNTDVYDLIVVTSEYSQWNNINSTHTGINSEEYEAIIRQIISFSKPSGCILFTDFNTSDADTIFINEMIKNEYSYEIVNYINPSNTTNISLFEKGYVCYKDICKTDIKTYISNQDKLCETNTCKTNIKTVLESDKCKVTKNDQCVVSSDKIINDLHSKCSSDQCVVSSDKTIKDASSKCSTKPLRASAPSFVYNPSIRLSDQCVVSNNKIINDLHSKCLSDQCVVSNDKTIKDASSKCSIKQLSASAPPFVSNKLLSLIKNTINEKISENKQKYIARIFTKYFPGLSNNTKTQTGGAVGENDHIFLMDRVMYLLAFIEAKFNTEIHDEKDIQTIFNLLLPFTSTESLDDLTDLNHLLCTDNNLNLEELKNLSREEALEKYFRYSNMAVGLLDDNFKLIDNKEKLMHKIIDHNFIALLRTVEMISHKLYVNWQVIFPIYDINKIQEIKKSTNELIFSDEHLYNHINTGEIDFNYKGIWLGDIYNIIVNRFYYDAIDIKWLLYPRTIIEDEDYEDDEDYDDEDKGTTIIHTLYNLLYYVKKDGDNNDDIDDNTVIIDSMPINIDETTEVEHNVKNDKLIYQIIDEYINNDELDKMDDMNKKYKLQRLNNLGSNIIYKLSLDNYICGILFTNLFNYTNINKYMNLDVNSVFVKKRKTWVKDDTQDDTYNIEIKDIKNFSQALKYSYKNKENRLKIQIILWNFLHIYINKLKVSAYGKYIFKNDEFIFKHEGNDKPPKFYNYNYKNLPINLKNIYNVSKTLSHRDKWIPCERNYVSLSREDKINWIHTLRNNNIKLFLQGNYKKQYNIINSNFDKNKYNKFINNILYSYQKIFIDLVVDDMVFRGTLSQYSKEKPTVEQLKDSNYYITNKKYDESFLETVLNNQPDWTGFYALDWLSQINFFNKYINHQILYVTGATGAGKSTQVPKLLLYGMKIIDYKEDGKIICTQPRTKPTEDNSSRIAFELGVSMFDKDKEPTNNFYVQMKHQKNDHTPYVDINQINNQIMYNTLKICTDGTLTEEIKARPIMKTYNEEGMITNNNIYDIIIIDEAHEHNPNMDIILTLAKQTCYLNNMVRLVIVSATMDNDEPIYRQYYKEINDNLLYPIKCPFINPFINDLFLYNSNYIDRRIHIAKPGSTTLFNIKEEYLDMPLEEYLNSSKTFKELSKDADKLAIDKALELCKKDDNGFILLFTVGNAEIKEAVEELNKLTPPHVVALPFFAQMEQSYKNIIDNMKDNLSRIRMSKEDISEKWFGRDKYEDDEDIPEGTYTRVIFVSTNIAEASITIENLTYVIDNGFSKVNKVIPELNIQSLVVKPISESSRIQRKGRVGRVGTGTVFYMYPEGSRKHIKSNYKITDDIPTEIILKLVENYNILDYSINDIIKFSVYKTESNEKDIINKYEIALNIDEIDPCTVNGMRKLINKVHHLKLNIKPKPYLVEKKYHTEVLEKNYYINYFGKANYDTENIDTKNIDTKDIDTIYGLLTNKYRKKAIKDINKEYIGSAKLDKLFKQIKEYYKNQNGNPPDFEQTDQYKEFEEEQLRDNIIWHYNHNDNNDFKNIDDIRNDGLYDVYFMKLKVEIVEMHIKDHTVYSDNDYSDNLEKYYLSNNKNKQTKLTSLGITFQTVLDPMGDFYIIHFFEDRITRNIYNNIIMFDDITTDKIDEKHYHPILIDMIKKNKMIDLSGKYNISTIELDNTCFVKSGIEIYVDKFNNLKTYDINKENADIEINQKFQFELTQEQVITLCMSKVLDCFDEVLKIIIFLMVIEMNIDNVITKNNKMKHNDFARIYQGRDSDLLFIYDILVKIEKYFDIDKLYNSINSKNEYDINNFKLWCDINYYDNTILEKYILKLHQNNIRRIIEEHVKYFIESLVSNISFTIDMNDKDQCIIRAFVFGYNNNFAFKVNTSDNFLKSPFSTKLLNVEHNSSTVISWYKPVTTFSTFTNRLYTTLLYLSLTSDTLTYENKISVVSRIEPEWLIPTGYFNLNIHKSYDIFNERLYGDAYDRFNTSIINNYTSDNILAVNMLPLMYYNIYREPSENYIYINLEYDLDYTEENINKKLFEISTLIDINLIKYINCKKGSIIINIIILAKPGETGYKKISKNFRLIDNTNKEIIEKNLGENHINKLVSVTPPITTKPEDICNNNINSTILETKEACNTTYIQKIIWQNILCTDKIKKTIQDSENKCKTQLENIKCNDNINTLIGENKKNCDTQLINNQCGESTSKVINDNKAKCDVLLQCNNDTNKIVIDSINDCDNINCNNNIQVTMTDMKEKCDESIIRQTIDNCNNEIKMNIEDSENKCKTQLENIKCNDNINTLIGENKKNCDTQLINNQCGESTSKVIGNNKAECDVLVQCDNETNKIVNDTNNLCIESGKSCQEKINDIINNTNNNCNDNVCTNNNKTIIADIENKCNDNVCTNNNKTIIDNNNNKCNDNVCANNNKTIIADVENKCNDNICANNNKAMIADIEKNCNDNVCTNNNKTIIADVENKCNDNKAIIAGVGNINNVCLNDIKDTVKNIENTCNDDVCTNNNKVIVKNIDNKCKIITPPFIDIYNFKIQDYDTNNEFNFGNIKPVDMNKITILRGTQITNNTINTLTTTTKLSCLDYIQNNDNNIVTKNKYFKYYMNTNVRQEQLKLLYNGKYGIKIEKVQVYNDYSTLLDNVLAIINNKTNYIMKLHIKNTDKVIVFGDYFGSFHTFYRNMLRLHITGVINLYEFKVNDGYYVIFLGNIISQRSFNEHLPQSGYNSIEIFEIIFKLIINSPDKVFLNRFSDLDTYDSGKKLPNNLLLINTNIPDDTYSITLSKEIILKLRDDNNNILNKFKQIFSRCPIAIILMCDNTKILLSQGLMTLDNEEFIKYVHNDELYYELDSYNANRILCDKITIDTHTRVSKLLENSGISFIIKNTQPSIYSNAWIPTPRFEDNNITECNDMGQETIKIESPSIIKYISRDFDFVKLINGPLKSISVQGFADINKDKLLPILSISTATEKSIMNDSFIVIRYNNNFLPQVSNTVPLLGYLTKSKPTTKIDIYNFKIKNYNTIVSSKFGQIKLTTDSDDASQGLIKTTRADIEDVQDNLSSTDYIYSNKYYAYYINNSTKVKTVKTKLTNYDGLMKILETTRAKLLQKFNTNLKFNLSKEEEKKLSKDCKKNAPIIIENASIICDNQQIVTNNKILLEGGYILNLQIKKDDKVIVFGDYHGSYHTFYRNMLRLHIMGVVNFRNFKVNEGFYVIFLGDIVDRGLYSIEILEIIFKFICNSPERMIINRGNHEEMTIKKHNKYTTIYQEIKIKYPNNYSDIVDNIRNIFKLCSSAIVIVQDDNKLWLSHGLIPHKINSKIIKSINNKQGIILQDSGKQIRWNDTPKSETSTKSERGNDIYNVGSNIVTEFLNQTDIQFIIRGHEDNEANAWVAVKPEFQKKEYNKDNITQQNGHSRYIYDLSKIHNNGIFEQTTSQNNQRSIPQVDGPINVIDVAKFQATKDNKLLPILTISTNTDNGRQLSSDSFIVIRFNDKKLPNINDIKDVDLEGLIDNCRDDTNRIIKTNIQKCEEHTTHNKKCSNKIKKTLKEIDTMCGESVKEDNNKKCTEDIKSMNDESINQCNTQLENIKCKDNINTLIGENKKNCETYVDITLKSLDSQTMINDYYIIPTINQNGQKTQPNINDTGLCGLYVLTNAIMITYIANNNIDINFINNVEEHKALRTCILDHINKDEISFYIVRNENNITEINGIYNFKLFQINFADQLAKYKNSWFNENIILVENAFSNDSISKCNILLKYQHIKIMKEFYTNKDFCITFMIGNNRHWKCYTVIKKNNIKKYLYIDSIPTNRPDKEMCEYIKTITNYSNIKDYENSITNLCKDEGKEGRPLPTFVRWWYNILTVNNEEKDKDALSYSDFRLELDKEPNLKPLKFSQGDIKFDETDKERYDRISPQLIPDHNNEDDKDPNINLQKYIKYKNKYTKLNNKIKQVK